MSFPYFTSVQDPTLWIWGILAPHPSTTTIPRLGSPDWELQVQSSSHGCLCFRRGLFQYCQGESWTEWRQPQQCIYGTTLMTHPIMIEWYKRAICTEWIICTMHVCVCTHTHTPHTLTINPSIKFYQNLLKCFGTFRQETYGWMNGLNLPFLFYLHSYT